MKTKLRPLMQERQLGDPQRDGRTIATQYESGAGRPVREVMQDLNVALFGTVPKYHGETDAEWESYLSRQTADGCRWGAPMVDYGFKAEATLRDAKWPDERDLIWIMCFAVTGSNEGYYIHIDAMVRVGERSGGYGERKRERVSLALAKCFDLDWAWVLAYHAGKLLGA